MISADALDLYLGRRSAWDTKPPPWAVRRSKQWYERRAQSIDAVITAAERAAAADTTIAPER